MSDRIIEARVAHAMTIPFTVQLVASAEPPSPQAARDRLRVLLDRLMPRIQQHLDRAEAAFSPFRDDSLVCRARRGDWSALLHDPQFAEIHAIAQQAKQLTGGAFDPMHAGVYDPTGIVKGWAVQRACETLLAPIVRDARNGVDAAAIGGGGDIQTLVRDDSDFMWRIGVQDPFDLQRTIRTVTLRCGAVATSGTARRGEHITRTDHALAQATVVDDQLVYADMWATAAISAGEARLRAMLERHGAGSVQAVLVRADGGIAAMP